MTSAPPPVRARGDLVWVTFDPTVGQEQRGTRPALVISSDDYLDSVRGVLVVLPVTSVDRGWPHHVPITGPTSGLPWRSFAMTEQPCTISTDRVARPAGIADPSTMQTVDRWLRDFLGT